MSNGTSRSINILTYRCKEEEGLFQIPKVGDESGADTAGNVLNEWMELFERLLFEDWLDDVLLDVSHSIRAQKVLAPWLRGAQRRR